MKLTVEIDRRETFIAEPPRVSSTTRSERLLSAVAYQKKKKTELLILHGANLAVGATECLVEDQPAALSIKRRMTQALMCSQMI